jgi:predicted nucleic acid-binding protein
MKFWDASAIVPLLIRESSTTPLRELIANDPDMAVWWASEVECVSALTRRERGGILSPREVASAMHVLQQLASGWSEIEPIQAVRQAAERFLRVHPLRAADALQLAAAYLASDRNPATLEFVTLDDRLAGAAQKEGFAVLEIALE